MKNTNEKSIVVFRSRNHSMKFYDFISQRKIRAEIINTPTNLGLGCGLSIKFNNRDVGYIHRAVEYLDLYSYVGIFAV